MSDFLTNLALKSTSAPGFSEVIQPRIPSLFEPRQNQLSLLNQTGFSAGEHNSVNELRGESEASPPLNRASDSEAPAARHFAPKPDRVDVQAHVRGTETHADSANSPIGILPQVVRREALAAPASPLLQSTQPSPQVSAQSLRRPEERVSEHVSDNPRTRRAAEPDSIRVPESARPPDSNTTNSAPFPARSQAAHTAQQDEVARLVRSLLPRAEARRDTRRPDSALASTTPSEPTIQVTIGRIELRAGAPQHAPQKERAAAPVMSLEEYLKQRRNSA